MVVGCRKKERFGIFTLHCPFSKNDVGGIHRFVRSTFWATKQWKTNVIFKVDEAKDRGKNSCVLQLT